MTVRVLYIGGSGRSGSTLVGRILGQIPGFVDTGELSALWWASLGENRPCGCGRPFDRCPFWAGVGAEHGGWAGTDPEQLRQAGAVSDLDALRWTLHGATRRNGLQHRHLAQLYEAISRQAGGATVIDSSKAPRRAMLLASLPELDVRAIHLVRDSRGVAYSWAKVVRRSDVRDQDVEMLRMSAPAVALRWILHNAMMEMVGRRIPVARLRYEQLLADPRAELERVLARLTPDLPAGALDFISRTTVQLEANHTVMGNPMRMQTGEVPLRVDDAWRTSMASPVRAAVTAMTWPFLVRYGYPLLDGRRPRDTTQDQGLARE
jgi:hypothetical protein